MRFFFNFVLATIWLAPGAMAGTPAAGESVPVPAPVPGPVPVPGPAPAPPSCSECDHAQILVCGYKDNSDACLCGLTASKGKRELEGVDGENDERQLYSKYEPPIDKKEAITCDVDDCCQAVGKCCQSPFASSYYCLATFVPQCDYGDFTVSAAADCCPDGTTSDGGRRDLYEIAATPVEDLTLDDVAHFTFTEEELLAHEILDNCHEEHFETFLFIDNTHFSAIASPDKAAEAAGCPYLVVTSLFGPDKPAYKKAWAWTDKNEGESLFPKNKKHSIGSFKGKNLLDAFEAASTSKPAPYDFLTNNCAEFMLNLASELGVEIDSEVVSFATRRLLEDKASGLMDKIKDSASYFSFFGERRLRGDEDEIIATLVGKRAGLE